MKLFGWVVVDKNGNEVAGFGSLAHAWEYVYEHPKLTVRRRGADVNRYHRMVDAVRLMKEALILLNSLPADEDYEDLGRRESIGDEPEVQA